MNTAASRKFFSVAQANQTLPLVRAIVQDIVELFRDVEERRERLTRVLQLRGSGRRSQEATLYTEELEQIGQDLVDLSDLSASVLEFRGTSGFSGGGTGSVRVVLAASGQTAILVDADGNSSAEMRILVDGGPTLTAADLIL